MSPEIKEKVTEPSEKNTSNNVLNLHTVCEVTASYLGGRINMP